MCWSRCWRRPSSPARHPHALVATLAGIAVAVACGLASATASAPPRRRQHLVRRVSCAGISPARGGHLRLSIDAVAGGGCRGSRSAPRHGRDAVLAESFVAPVTAQAGFAARLTILGAGRRRRVVLRLLLDLLDVVSWARHRPLAQGPRARVKPRDDRPPPGGGRTGTTDVTAQAAAAKGAVKETGVLGGPAHRQPHLGNYLGAIVNFVKLQDTHN